MGCDCVEESDSGKLLLSPCMYKSGKKLADGTSVMWFHQTGYTLGCCVESPLYCTTSYTIGTTLRDVNGRLLLNAELIQFISANGEIIWVTGYNECNPDRNTYTIKTGTGKWKDIRGEINLKGSLKNRADGHIIVGWDMTHWIEKGYKDRETYDRIKDKYSEYDTGYSFHGPHFTDSETVLSNGYTLVYNNQTGVLLSRNENSPRHNATCCDRGVSIYRKGMDKAICDICFLEDTDADGDMAWLFHEWWYLNGQGVPPLGTGTYEFIGGTGKWNGIRGVGRTLDLVRMRADDWWMPAWEMKWDI